MCLLSKKTALFLVWIIGLFTFASFSFAQAPSTLYYQTYLNLDGNPATGCTVTVPDNAGANQTLSGVDVSVVVTVTNGALVSAERFACVGGALASQGADPDHPTYTLTGNFIEYRIPNVTITPQTTVGFAASTSPNFNIPPTHYFKTPAANPSSSRRCYVPEAETFRFRCPPRSSFS
ncbi:MAG: hypothetical protein FWC38_06910 [Proteobacteria bacterium]|nr:hypothetical protein [Pseudomonadota bacterium]MCL2307933.1 hypothetical protein [Pseudomonadota bacterium]